MAWDLITRKEDYQKMEIGRHIRSSRNPTIKVPMARNRHTKLSIYPNDNTRNMLIVMHSGAIAHDPCEVLHGPSNRTESALPTEPLVEPIV